MQSLLDSIRYNLGLRTKTKRTVTKTEKGICITLEWYEHKELFVVKKMIDYGYTEYSIDGVSTEPFPIKY